ncbi:hypothetical protein [Martelella sp. HB161492]|uniref:ABC transporter substrate-binding protein n=1 Tax=Martelella sp. HB161492 TaxID=2720726 RepID=UPI0015919B5D|nr:hypothetical protein [Martelella sp. HB161492]
MSAARDSQIQSLRLGTGRYDRIQPLANGRVEAPFIDWKPMSVAVIPSAFARGELDLAEISFGELLALRQAGERVKALPVFPSIGFRHDTLYVAAGSPLATGSDLAGKRIGATLLHGTTTMWVREILRRQYGVGYNAVKWMIGPLDKPVETAKTLPEGPLDTAPIAAGDTQVAMLLRGELDAILSYKVPAEVGSGQMRRLFSRPEEEWQRDLQNGGTVPLLHVIAMREELAEAKPALPDRLFRAFVAARDLALSDLAETAVFTTSLPFLSEVVEKAAAVMPSGIWPYGLDSAGPGIETFLDMAHDQSLVAKRYAADDVFFDLRENEC